MLGLLSAQLGDKKYFGGDKQNIGDFYVYAWLTSICLNNKGNPARTALYARHAELLKTFKNMSEFGDRMYAELKEYMDARGQQSL